MPQQDFWVFAYGSLIWNPGFEYEERVLGSLNGFRRAFCMQSIEYRGTPAKPGLVLALEPRAEASCRGLALRVGAANAEATLEYLRERELITDAYTEERQRVTLTDGRVVEAVCYVMNTVHTQYCGALTLSEQAQIIFEAEGRVGRNCAYLHSTVHALQELGINDPELEELDHMVWTKKGGRPTN